MPGLGTAGLGTTAEVGLPLVVLGPTAGNIITVQDWDDHPLREYLRSNPVSASPVRTIISNTQNFVAPSNANENDYPAFTSQLNSGDLVVMGSTPGSDVVQVSASNTIATYLSWADLVAAVPALADASRILNARVDSADRLVLVWQDGLDSSIHVARFLADKTLDLTEVIGADGSGPGYVAISPTGTKLAYLMQATISTQFGNRGEVTFREWAIGGSETTLATYAGTLDNPYAQWDYTNAPPPPPYPYPVNAEFDTVFTGSAFGYAANGDPVLLFFDRKAPPTILLFGKTDSTNFPDRRLYPGDSHTWAFSHGTYGNGYTEVDANWPLPEPDSSEWTDFTPASPTTWTGVPAPKDGIYDIYVEGNLDPEGTDTDSISTVSLRINGSVVNSLTQPGYNGYAGGFSFTYTGTLSAGDVITVTAEADAGNVLYVDDQIQLLVAGIQDGWEYTLYAQRFGASPSVQPLLTYVSSPRSIFIGDPYYNLTGSGDGAVQSPPWTPPFMALDEFDGHTTAWLWFYDNETFDNYLAEVNLATGVLTQLAFEDVPGGASDAYVPIWVAAGSRIRVARRRSVWFMG